MSYKSKLILTILALFLTKLVCAATDDCTPCEDGDPNCGGQPGGDSMSIVLGE